MVDVAVIGAGHAGVEAAAAAARVGVNVALITLDRRAIARLSCNPAMGGAAKGQLIKEIDALGGVMPRATDLAAIQYRMLNRSKGPAVWSPRAQVDRDLYTQRITNLFTRRYPQVDVIEDEAVAIHSAGSTFTVAGTAGSRRRARTVVICSGTFLNGLVHIGRRNWPSGRYVEPAAASLTRSLQEFGFPIRRFKTGTPPRVWRDTIDFSQLERQDSDSDLWFFSYESTVRELPQQPCWRAYSTPDTHALVSNNLEDSPLFNGTIQSTGPRYCPSFEDKIVRFPDRERHPLILEPEGIEHDWYYLNGFSSSLPEEVQLAAVRTVPGLEQARFGRPGYAIEYDIVPPEELRRTLETRRAPGLYLAGQINGTSGYEEAGVQGLVAGANAALAVKNEPAFTMGRDEAYAGVLIDDLLTTHPDEPYRMFTSRAEYRLLLRQDNAEERLGEKAFAAGLIDRERIEGIRERLAKRDHWIDILRRSSLPRRAVLANDPEPDRVENAAHLVKRPDVRLAHVLAALPEPEGNGGLQDPDLHRAVEIEIVYEGYLERQRREVARLKAQESRTIPFSLNFETITGLSAEARQKLLRHRPETIGQASRIAGVTPSDIALLLVTMKKTQQETLA